MKSKIVYKNRQLFYWLSCCLGMVMVFAGHFSLAGVPLGTDMPPETNKMKPDHAPTPFSAAEIHEGCPSGRVIRYRIVVPGKADVFRLMMFKKCNTESAGFSSKTLNTDGKRVGETTHARVEWEELQGHASFPAAAAIIKSEKYDTPMGTMDCWLYTVKREGDDGTEESRFWFAKTLKGPPVYFVKKVNGKIVYEMKMIQNVMPKK